MASRIPKVIQTQFSVKSRSGLSNKILLGIVAVVLMFLSLVGFGHLIKAPVLFVFEPFSYYGNQSGVAVKRFFTTILEVGDLHDENLQLKEENARLMADVAMYNSLQQKYLALQKEVELGNSKSKQSQALVTKFDPSGYLMINIGSKDGIRVDDVAVLGNLYIGRIVQVERNFSKVRTPLSQDSVLQVEVNPKFSSEDSQEILQNTFDSIKKTVTHGVMNGTPTGIIVEDVLQGSLVERGDSVIVNDSKIGLLLLVGNVSEISIDVAKAEKELSIDPIINYEELSYIYILGK